MNGKRILIMSASVGSGHTRSAHALTEAFRTHPGVAEVINDDALEHTNVLHKQIYSDLYKTLSSVAPNFLGWWYETTNEPWRSDQVRMLLDLPSTLPLMSYLKKTKPDAIVCTHFMPAGVVSYLIGNQSLDTRLYTVVTDFHFHAEWLLRAFNQYFVAQEEDRQHMIGLGLPGDRIAVTGIPIDAQFSETVDRQKVCDQFGLNPGVPIVLVSAGTLGLSPATSVLKRLLDMPEEFQTIVICGKNEEMQAEVEGLAAASPKKIVVIGYTAKISALMKTATVLLSKPGGLITSEALACGLPMVILDPIGGQEERNADVLLEKGAAIKCTEVTLLPYKLGQLLNDPARIAIMSENARSLGFPHAAQDIVDHVMSDDKASYIIDSKREKVLRKRANEG